MRRSGAPLAYAELVARRKTGRFCGGISTALGVAQVQARGSSTARNQTKPWWGIAHERGKTLRQRGILRSALRGDTLQTKREICSAKAWGRVFERIASDPRGRPHYQMAIRRQGNAGDTAGGEGPLWNLEWGEWVSGTWQGREARQGVWPWPKTNHGAEWTRQTGRQGIGTGIEGQSGFTRRRMGGPTLDDLTSGAGPPILRPIGTAPPQRVGHPALRPTGRSLRHHALARRHSPGTVARHPPEYQPPRRRSGLDNPSNRAPAWTRREPSTFRRSSRPGPRSATVCRTSRPLGHPYTN